MGKVQLIRLTLTKSAPAHEHNHISKRLKV